MNSLKTFIKLHINHKKKGNLSLLLPHIFHFPCSIFSPQALIFLSRQKSSVILSSACFSLITDTNTHTFRLTQLYALLTATHTYTTHCSWKIKQHDMVNSCIVCLVNCQQLVAWFATNENQHKAPDSGNCTLIMKHFQSNSCQPQIANWLKHSFHLNLIQGSIRQND